METYDQSKDWDNVPWDPIRISVYEVLYSIPSALVLLFVFVRKAWRSDWRRKFRRKISLFSPHFFLEAVTATCPETNDCEPISDSLFSSVIPYLYLSEVLHSTEEFFSLRLIAGS